MASKQALGEVTGTGATILSLIQDPPDLPARQLGGLIEAARCELGAETARVLIADYALVSLQELGEDGPTGARQSIEGTLAGRSFARHEIVVSRGTPTTIWAPLAEGSDRFGVLELEHASWSDGLHHLLQPVLRILVLALISKCRYTDSVLRSRRTEPLSLAAEMQWDLLPPLTCSTSRASVSGILEPAYSIGGDSFDFSLNSNRLDFAIFDAVGHGMSAVLMSVAAVTSLRNARRSGSELAAVYQETDKLIQEQFGLSSFVTAQFGSLAIDTGELTWLNAGHPRPLLVRDDSCTGELSCRPSLPMGLGGSVVAITTDRLQPGDRVLFFTDGVTEARSPDGDQFGVPQLADLLVRATLDRLSTAETVRRLSGSVLAHNGAALRDDATLLLIDYHGSDGPDPH